MSLALSAEGTEARGESDVGSADGGKLRHCLCVRKRGQVFVVSLVAHTCRVLQERSGKERKERRRGRKGRRGKKRRKKRGQRRDGD